MFGKISSWWSPTPAADDKPYNPSDPKMNPLNPKGLKPCCACPETKSKRDDCFLRYDPSEAEGKCKDELAAHIACMRSLGFKV
ncbi:Cytochrome c oxidase copper chaperone [Psilocybe cubensis]|uniref:Cytochrome c oxidase copper chaperone n=2 Tax=Psilocybe cubensis TaxID=181762 RepID=A0A8H7Y1H6_PSICU|nr:Cytochrome c oxidase copper chaperone [Psilocybe cubensis]KAH9483669.1 Cytochrome c oxidase copper chaperone [Psilocybe cubensis]